MGGGGGIIFIKACLDKISNAGLFFGALPGPEAEAVSPMLSIDDFLLRFPLGSGFFVKASIASLISFNLSCGSVLLFQSLFIII